MSLNLKPRTSFARWVSSLLLIATVILITLQLIAYSRNRANFPTGLVVAGIPVGGISRQQAAERLLEVYRLPVELHYGEERIHMDPVRVEFSMNLEGMIAAADLERTSAAFWVGFWDYLWGGVSDPAEVPLDASYSEEALIAYLQNEIAVRYDKPPAPAQPIAGTTQFDLGEPGTVVNIVEAAQDIERALFSPTDRVVLLGLQRSSPARPNVDNLQVQLQQVMDVAGYDGLADIYFLDLVSGQELHFAYRLGSNLPTEPVGINFTAASIIKIPILVSVYSRLDGPPDEATLRLLNEMIVQSENTAADQLMESVLDPIHGPTMVTEDVQALGLENTFLAGQFYIGAPLLRVYSTPAQGRSDIYAPDDLPDIYNQTSTADIGMLLADIYQCAESGGGALVAVFQQRINQAECQDILNLLSQNRIGVLLETGAPEGTRIAHKHGWVTNPNTGVINTMGDAGIVFTPNGAYVIVIFLYQPVQLIYDPIEAMFGDLSEAIYNYYTIPDQEFN
ncbi:MAG: serine hydrolase [Anaerolineales bacterium]